MEGQVYDDAMFSSWTRFLSSAEAIVLQLLTQAPSRYFGAHRRGEVLASMSGSVYI